MCEQLDQSLIRGDAKAPTETQRFHELLGGLLEVKHRERFAIEGALTVRRCHYES